MRLIITLGLAALSLSTISTAEIYRSVDEHGNPVFSDTKDKDSIAVDLPVTNTTPAVDTPTTKQNKRRPAISEDIPDIKITAPRDGQIFPNGLVATQVRTSLSKPLPKGFRIAISLNGQLLVSGRQTDISIPRLNRGPHRIRVQLFNEQDEVIRSDSIQIMAYWPSN